MKKIFSYFMVAAFTMFAVAGCHKPEALVPSTVSKCVNTFTVYSTWDGYHSADNTGFGSAIDYDAHTITVQVPYTYPVSSDNVQKLSDYTKVWCLFNLDDNVYVEPSMMTMDLTKTYSVTITDQEGRQTPWTIKAALSKSSLCDVESFTVKGIGASAVVDKAKRQLMLTYMKDLQNVFADYKLSSHATIVPDPAVKAFWCSIDKPKTFTVIAQDGVTSQEWTLVQKTPTKVEEGINKEKGGTLLWAKKLSAIGVPAFDITNGIAAVGENLIINNIGYDPIILNGKTGEKVGTVNLGSFKGGDYNYYMTSDDAGHLVYCNHVAKSGTFKIFRLKDFNSQPELFISYDKTSDKVLGSFISVKGDVYGDAIITTCYSGWTAAGTTSNFYWTVTGGVPGTITWRPVKGINTWTNADLCHVGTAPTSDFFVMGYSMNTIVWVDGNTNTARSAGVSFFTGNEQSLAVDVVTFNGMVYALAGEETSFSWGVSGAMTMLEAKSPSLFTGKVEKGSAASAAIVYSLDRGDDGIGKYGGRLNDAVNTNAYVDVKFQVSDDGYYLYAYFMFCNGYVGCVQFDCIAG